MHVTEGISNYFQDLSGRGAVFIWFQHYHVNYTSHRIKYIITGVMCSLTPFYNVKCL